MEEQGTWGKPWGVKDRGSLALTKVKGPVRRSPQRKQRGVLFVQVVAPCGFQGLWGMATAELWAPGREDLPYGRAFLRSVLWSPGWW